MKRFTYHVNRYHVIWKLWRQRQILFKIGGYKIPVYPESLSKKE